jgi:hypothetical protein
VDARRDSVLTHMRDCALNGVDARQKEISRPGDDHRGSRRVVRSLLDHSVGKANFRNDWQAGQFGRSWPKLLDSML